MSADTLKTLSCSVNGQDKQAALVGSYDPEHGETLRKPCDTKAEGSLILTGLHACGDLSVTMLRSFAECKDIKAVVSLGCCYNLLSEEVSPSSDSQYGFPLSNAVKCEGFILGKRSRDLACQSADRWRNLGDESGVHNFELHVFRAAFQMALDEYYPNISTYPAIGRQGKSLRRQQWRGVHKSGLDQENNIPTFLDQNQIKTEADVNFPESVILVGGESACTIMDPDSACDPSSPCNTIKSDGTAHTDRYPLFERFCHHGFCRLGLEPLTATRLFDIWNAIEPFSRLVGPYWSLRSVLGPLVETVILLDRLLYLQEQGSHVEAFMIPIFNPVISPRNVAIIATRVDLLRK